MDITTMDLEMVSFIAEHSEHNAVRRWWRALDDHIQQLRDIMDVSEIRRLSIKVFDSEPVLMAQWAEFVEAHPEI